MHGSQRYCIAAVLQYLDQHRICAMKELFRTLSPFTVNQMLLTVDRLNREGKVLLRYQNRREYLIAPDVARQWFCRTWGMLSETDY
jgi:hypothetical protein